MVIPPDRVFFHFTRTGAVRQEASYIRNWNSLPRRTAAARLPDFRRFLSQSSVFKYFYAIIVGI